ncbi:25855_t:CDS:2, partial [Dentiscutata erythropus]
NALNNFHTLVNEMNPHYKTEGCDYEGVDAYLYEELKNFKEKLKSENFSDNTVNEIYTDYHKSVSLIVSEIKTNIAILTAEVQNFQNRFDELVSIIELPRSKQDLTMSINELTQQLWSNFNDIVKDFPEGFVQQRREKLENLFEEKTQYIVAENKKKIISFAQKTVKDNLRRSVKKLKNRLPMIQNKLESELFELFNQSKEMYIILYTSLDNVLDDTTFPDDLHTILNPFRESLLENNGNAWKNKAVSFRKRAETLFKRTLDIKLSVNDRKVFNDTEIQQYTQEETLKFSYTVSNIFPHTMMDDIFTKYKENVHLIVTKFQEKKNKKNIKEISQKIERYILDWDILLDVNERNDLERWQHEVAELLLISNNIPELAILPSLQLLYICNDLTNLNREIVPSSFREVIRSIIRRDMGDILFEQFVIVALEVLESNELKFAQMSFINRCLSIKALTSPIRRLFYKLLFVHKPFMFANPIIRRIFLTEYEKYQNEGHQNAFFDLLRTPQVVFNILPDLKIINDLLKGDDLDSPIAALSCDIIQKTFFVRYGLTDLHHNFSSAVDSLSTNNIEPLQNITAIAFLKEYVRAFCDANIANIRAFCSFKKNKKKTKKSTDTYMNNIIRDINYQLESELPRVHSLKIYFLKYLLTCNFSMQDIKDLCESQEQTFPWLKEIPWGDKENQLSFNPYWLHQDYKYAEYYYYYIYDYFKCDEVSDNNDLVIFAGVIAARLHLMRTLYEWTNDEKRIVNYLTKEIRSMNAPSVYKEILEKLLLNSNSLIQLINDDDELFMKTVIVHLIIVHASIPSDASPLAAYLHQLQVCQDDFILTCPSDVEGVVMNAIASFSFSSKCLNCKRTIGHGSTTCKRLDEQKITSFPIKHEPGYISEPISAEKTHNVRMLTPKPYRILHLFVHALLGASVPSSITSKFFAKNGNNADNQMKLCLVNIRNDWNILKERFDCSNEQLALILHSIISSMINEPASSWRLDTPEKREEWEYQFS